MPQRRSVTKPLALVFYESLLIGNRLLNRLRELGYRTALVKDLSRLGEQAREEKPILVVVELAEEAARACTAVGDLKKQEATTHIPALAFAQPRNRKHQAQLGVSARNAGIEILADESGILAQLPEILDHLLQVE